MNKEEFERLSQSKSRQELELEGPLYCGRCGSPLVGSINGERELLCVRFKVCGYSYSMEQHDRRLRIRREK